MRYIVIAQLYWPVWFLFGGTKLAIMPASIMVIVGLAMAWRMQFPRATEKGK